MQCACIPQPLLVTPPLLPPPAVLVVTHGDLINRFVPSFEFDDSIGRYSASECGWLACTGLEPLVDYEGDTIDLGLVPRVHASAGLEPL